MAMPRSANDPSLSTGRSLVWQSRYAGFGNGSGAKRGKKSTKKGRSSRARKSKAARVPKVHAQHYQHPSTATGASPGGAGVGVDPWSGHLTAGAGMGPLELSGDMGLAEVVLDLAGEGHLSLGHALTAWQREQERVTNRVWRRPGGLQRMGGL